MMETADVFRFQIEPEMEENRIDKCMSLLLDSLSRSYIQKLIKEGKVSVNGNPVKANYKVRTDDEIMFFLPKAVEPDIRPENLPLNILYEDDDLLFVNKPKDMVVHPAAGHYSGTLVNAVMYHCAGKLSGINGVMRPGIVHRIDKDTTGVLVICKNDTSHNLVAAQLKEHSITRKYRAICFGNLKEESGTIHASIGRSQNDRKKMAICESGGKDAITHYRVLKQLNGYSYIECELETGRTHQIRVHMASIGHPLLGDTVYTARKQPFSLNGQTLHAMVLGLIHPTTGKYLEIEAPLPEYFTDLLNKL